MFLISSIFWIILSLGVAIPTTFSVIITLVTKLVAGESYSINIPTLFKIYLIALLSWAIFVAEILL